jgi:replicative DNA helicase Mcm
MEKTIGDLFMLFRPLGGSDKAALKEAKNYLDNENVKDLATLVKQKKVIAKLTYLPISKDLFKQTEKCVIFEAKTMDDTVVDYVGEANQQIQKKFFKNQYKAFAKDAPQRIAKLIAPHIIGHDVIKRAVALQLFASDPVHVLLLGDPAIGKTDILRSAADYHPISIFGLGSGMSGVGLAVSVIGDVVEPGLLPQADQGLACIDELNLLKDDSKGALYNAMEKGFVTYDKQGKHLRLDASIRVLATANPKGNKFKGKTLQELRKQIPFDQALLSRFHLVFLVKKPDTYQFLKIADKILKHKEKPIGKMDKEFLKSYICYAEQLPVVLPEVYHKEIVEIVHDLKKKEKGSLLDISPRLVVGIKRLVTARARMCLRAKVTQEDISEVKLIVERGLKVQ